MSEDLIRKLVAQIRRKQAQGIGGQVILSDGFPGPNGSMRAVWVRKDERDIETSVREQLARATG